MAIFRIDSYVPYDSNIYLVTGERTMLVDTGTGAASEPIIENIAEILNGRKLDFVVLTHRHFDHIGGLKDIVPAFRPEVLAGAADAEEIRRGGRDPISGMMLHPCEDVRELSEGDTIDLGEHVLRVIETPGHTEGGICLYDTESGALFSGDTVFGDGIGRTDFKGGNIVQLRESLRKLSKLEINGFYPGHGPCAENGGGESVTRGLRYAGG